MNAELLKTIISLCIERAAFSAPGPDEKMTPETAADVQAILLPLQEDGAAEAAVSDPG